jgi:solute carrier family 66 (lysosomal lysine-arginine transporter), member 1
VPTVIALAIYFCIADFVLISQCLYYNHINARLAKRHLSSTSGQPEDEPLLSRARSNSSIGLPGSRRRSSARRPSLEIRRDSLSKILEDDESPNGKAWLRNIISILLVCIVGAVGWFIAYKSGVWTPTPEDSDLTEPQSVAIGAELLGYFSALCYLG